MYSAPMLYFQVLRISEKRQRRRAAGPTMEEIQKKAAREVEQALALSPDLENGLEIYRDCAACHKPEGWGLGNGSVPHIAAQHRKVVIKQLADIRAGNRDAHLMLPYASADSIGGAQSVADVAVIGVPDDKYGEALLAFVVLQAGAALELEEMIEFCREHIAGYKIPRRMQVVDELPRNPSGKILKKILREPYWKDAGRAIG